MILVDTSVLAPPPARHWRLRTRTLLLDRGPLWMGIVNVTPDSFSDGGRCFEPAAAVEHALRLAAEGADILDIGGQSTRPRSKPVPADEELRRVLPVVTALGRQTSVPLSIDTYRAAVAREAIAAGAEIINDVSGLTAEGQMVEVARQTACAVCVMHMQGTPQTMQDDPQYQDVVGEVAAYLAQRRDALQAAGIDADRIALDPGIGFGKNLDHNLQLFAAARRFHALGCPLVFGPSRKRFIGELLGDLAADRTAGTIGAALALAGQGVQVIRVHDVAAVRGAWKVYGAAASG